MQNLSRLSDQALHLKTQELAREERRLAIEVLHHLREIERRMLYAKRGHSGLLEYCMAELGYTRNSAQRRIDSMRVLSHVPSVEVELASGRLSLSHLSEAQSFFRKEEIQASGEKKAILEQLVGKSVRDAQRTLMTMTDQPEKHIPERTRVVSAGLTEVRFVVDQVTLAEIEELKALLSHACPGMGVKEALQYGLKLALAKHRVKEPRTRVNANQEKSVKPAEPNQKAERITLVPTSVPTATPALATVKAPSSARSKISAETRRQVYHQEGGSCGHTDPETGRRCGSRFFLELDHIVPRALGGSDDVASLRLRCRTHNALAAIETLGSRVMQPFLPAIRG
jgi:hypothetical protein